MIKSIKNNTDSNIALLQHWTLIHPIRKWRFFFSNLGLRQGKKIRSIIVKAQRTVTFNEIIHAFDIDKRIIKSLIS